jgi:hypothetical protein
VPASIRYMPRRSRKISAKSRMGLLSRENLEDRKCRSVTRISTSRSVLIPGTGNPEKRASKIPHTKGMRILRKGIFENTFTAGQALKIKKSRLLSRPGSEKTEKKLISQ